MASAGDSLRELRIGREREALRKRERPSERERERAIKLAHARAHVRAACTVLWASSSSRHSGCSQPDDECKETTRLGDAALGETSSTSGADERSAPEEVGVSGTRAGPQRSLCIQAHDENSMENSELLLNVASAPEISCRRTISSQVDSRTECDDESHCRPL